MENASKALIIAGAILLSILIIALGIYVFTSAKGATRTDQLDALEISTFNDKFTQYEGKQLGSSVKKLLGDVISSNQSNSGTIEKLIKVNAKKAKVTKYNGTYTYISGTGNNQAIRTGTNFTNVTNQISNLRSGIADTHYYNVTFNYNDSGYIDEVIIDYNK